MVTYGEIGTLSAGVVAGVDLAADTETTVSTITMVRDGTIKQIFWNYGNVVNAKAATGYLELKSNTQTLPFRIPVGLGSGGATNSNATVKGKMDVQIGVLKNEVITITMTMNEACVSAHAGILYTEGKGSTITLADCNTVETAAVSAATLTSLGNITLPAGKGGRIKKILVAFADVVDAKTAAGYVDLRFSNLSGEFRFPIGGGNGGAATSSLLSNAEEIDVDLPVLATEIVTPWVYFTDAKVNVQAGIVWVTG